MKNFKLFLLLLIWAVAALMGFFIPLACTNTSGEFIKTMPATPVTVVPSATATNAFGFTATPTFTIQPTSTITNTPVITPMTGPATLCAPNAPNGLAVGGGNLYVAGGDGTLSIYTLGTPPLTLVTTINQYSLTGASFSSLSGVAIDSTGKLFVLDTGGSTTSTGTIYEFDTTSSNSPVTYWNNYNGATFISPQGVAVDSNNNLYVADTGNNVIDEFGPAALNSPVSQLMGYAGGGGNGGLNNPTGISTDGSGSSVTVYVADMDDELIQAFNPRSGAYIPNSQFSTPAESLPSVPGVMGIALDNSGNVFAADYNNGLVEEYHLASSPVTVFEHWKGPASPQNPFSPSAVVVANQSPETIYVADYDNNAIYSVTP